MSAVDSVNALFAGCKKNKPRKCVDAVPVPAPTKIPAPVPEPKPRVPMDEEVARLAALSEKIAALEKERRAEDAKYDALVKSRDADINSAVEVEKKAAAFWKDKAETLSKQVPDFQETAKMREQIDELERTVANLNITINTRNQELLLARQETSIAREELAQTVARLTDEAKVEAALKKQVADSRAAVAKTDAKLVEAQTMLIEANQVILVAKGKEADLEMKLAEAADKVEDANEIADAAISGLADWKDFAIKAAAEPLSVDSKAQVTALLNSDALFTTKRQDAANAVKEYASQLLAFAKEFGKAVATGKQQTESRVILAGIDKLTGKIGRKLGKIAASKGERVNPEAALAFNSIATYLNAFMNRYQDLVLLDKGRALTSKEMRKLVTSKLTEQRTGFIHVSDAGMAYIDEAKKKDENVGEAVVQVLANANSMFISAGKLVEEYNATAENTGDRARFEAKLNRAIKAVILYATSQLSHTVEELKLAEEKKSEILDAFKTIGSELYVAINPKDFSKSLGEKGKNLVKKINPFKDEIPKEAALPTKQRSALLKQIEF